MAFKKSAGGSAAPIQAGRHPAGVNSTTFRAFKPITEPPKEFSSVASLASNTSLKGGSARLPAA